jgi:twinkle protein
MQAKEVSQQLAQRAEDIARRLYPDGKRHGSEWCVGSVSGEQGKSLKIHLKGNKAGVWSDFATGDGGDLLDLWARKNNLTIGEALKEACDHLGIKKPHFEFQKAKQFAKPKKQEFNLLPVKATAASYLVDERKLTMETLNAFKVSQTGQDIIFPYLRDGQAVFIKYLSLERKEGKKQVRVEANCEPCLFGWHLIPKNARSVTLCEGEIDAMSLYQLGIPALSVPFGAGSGNKHAWFEYEFDRLAVFDEIFICMDNDSEGEIATREIVGRLGAHRCRVVELPLKDPNECLQEGFNGELIKPYFHEAVSLDPEELKRLGFFEEELSRELFPIDGIILGYNPPWEKTNKKILFRPAELSVWSGINGHGKSQFLGQVMLGMMNQGAKICLVSLELKPTKLIARLVKQATGMGEPSPEYSRGMVRHYNDNMWIFNVVGNAKSGRLLEVFKYARQRYGVDVFVIDSFMMMDIAEDDYKAQKSFMEKLCEFKNQYDCHVHIVVHPRKGADEATAPNKMDYKGTGAISDLADNCFSIWRNKAKEHAVQKQNQGYPLTDKEAERLDKPDCLWFCDKQRHGDWEGSLAFWYDVGSYQYLETEGRKPKAFFKFSCLQS